jgi:hypothetical protein
MNAASAAARSPPGVEVFYPIQCGKFHVEMFEPRHIQQGQIMLVAKGQSRST